MSTPKLIYSFAWACDVVQAFVEKYPRGIYFVSKMADIPTQQLFYYMVKQVRSANQLNWEAIKRCVKTGERENFQDYKHLPVEGRRKWLNTERTLGIYEALDKE